MHSEHRASQPNLMLELTSRGARGSSHIGYVALGTATLLAVPIDLEVVGDAGQAIALRRAAAISTLCREARVGKGSALVGGVVVVLVPVAVTETGCVLHAHEAGHTVGIKGTVASITASITFKT